MDKRIGSFGSQPYPIDSNRKKVESAPNEAKEATSNPQPEAVGDHFSFSAVRDGESTTADSGLASLFQKLLGRSPSQKESDRWSGFDLADVERYIKRSTEYRVRLYGETVRNVFQDILGRMPKELEMDRYTDMLADGTSESQLRKKIKPSLTIKSGINRLQIDESNAAVGNAPGAARITGDVTAITDTQNRDFTKGAVVSKTQDGAQYAQYANNGITTVRTPEGGLVYQNPKEKKMVIFTSEGWAVEAKIAQYQGVDKEGRPATKNYVQLKVTDPKGNVKLDRTSPEAQSRTNSLQLGSGLVECTSDRQSGAVNDISVSLPGLKVTFGSEGDSSVKVASNNSDIDGSTLKYRADKFESTLSGLGRAYYDSSATEPELPKIPTLSEPWVPTTPTSPTSPTTPTLPTTSTVPTAPTTPTLPTLPTTPTMPTVPTTPSAPTVPNDPVPPAVEPPVPQPVDGAAGGGSDLIGTAGRVANSAYQATRAAKPIAEGLSTLIKGAKGAESAMEAAEGAAIAAETAEGAAVAAETAKSGATIAKSANVAKSANSGFMSGLKGLATTVGKAMGLSALIEGGISIVENVFKAYKGEETAGQAMRNVATDTATGAITGGLAATTSALTTTLLTTLGVLGGPIGIIAAAGVGMATYWLARGPIRGFFSRMFGAEQPATQPTATN